MRTQGRLDCDTAYTDGRYFIPAAATQISSGTSTLTRSGLGLVGLAITGAVVIDVRLGEFILRTGVQDYLQENFGSAAAGGAQGLATPARIEFLAAATAAGATTFTVANTVGLLPGNKLVIGSVASGVQETTTIVSVTNATTLVVTALKNAHVINSVVSQNAFTTPAAVGGVPPFPGISQYTPLSAPRPKGVQITSLTPVWTPGATAPTVNNIGLTQTVFSNAVAPVVTAILAPTNLSLATGTNPLVQTAVVTNPPWLTVPLAEYIIEWNITATTGLLYGVWINFNYNLN